jgi:hypothetical protein
VSRQSDTIQGNAVSRLAALKQREHQADSEVPSILWVDLNNHLAFPLPLGASQAQPLLGGCSELVSGILWWMNYGQRGDPIFDTLSLGTFESKYYRLEFDARFSKESRFAATVCALDGLHLLHQNPQSAALTSDWIVELLQLSGARFEDWWVDWPRPGSLANEIAMARENSIELVKTRYPEEFE